MAKKDETRQLPDHARRAFEEGGSVTVGGVVYDNPDDLPEDAFEPNPVQPLPGAGQLSGEPETGKSEASKG